MRVRPGLGAAVVGVLLLAAALAGLIALGDRSSRSRPNIVIVVGDTCRVDRFGCYGCARELTPHVDRLAGEGVVFQDAITNAPWTLPSHASLFTGCYPARHGCYWKSYALAPGRRTLAEALTDEGYQTAAFFGNPWLKMVTRGFEEIQVVDIGGLSTMVHASGDKGAAETNRRLGDWLSRTRDPDRPFFVFVNFLEAHLPYNPTPEFRRQRLPPEYRDKVISIDNAHRNNARREPLTRSQVKMLNALYDGGVSQTDAAVGELLELLATSADLDNTLIVFLSDHGENLADHGLMDHQFSVHEALLRIPLVMRLPRTFEPGSRSSRPVQVVDVAPTILDVVGLDDGVMPRLDGLSVLRPLPAPSTHRRLAEYYTPDNLLVDQLLSHDPDLDLSWYLRNLKAMYQEGYKYVWGSDESRELYQLNNEVNAERNVIDHETDRAREMHRRMVELARD